ncbi:MucB/RseB C-terminal domain-containing protein [Halomonas vilamensis]|uniref:MucB/RseB C-terminal domain-containing protein n=1 Tax=Vreelandella vilamensis TaxID=531309 RepID=A0ABU1H6C6_9GAMM|nr:MucB/RseB C-terminal domain-containing protein [Halomonas vilamensis]MDR5899851.1 MucB/RseB C-terminal domain-containing protein [Halomonas vilamensis]
MTRNVFTTIALTYALYSVLLFAYPVSADEPWLGTKTLNCSALEGQSPTNAQQWLSMSLWASHCYSYQARAVTIDESEISTLALSHRIQDGIRQQVVQYLDGPSMSIERHVRVGHWGWMSAPEADVSIPTQWAEHLGDIYAISLEGDKRVAGRDAVQITFDPHDTDRYPRQWWLDAATGLVLKHVLRNTDDDILETFQVTQLQDPERFSGNVDIGYPESAPSTDWQVNWLPRGFQLQSGVSRELSDGRVQQLYSDGLATVSVFVEPVSASSFLPGVHRLGVSAVAVERYQDSNAVHQVVAIGEVPPEVLRRVVRSVERVDNVSE